MTCYLILETPKSGKSRGFPKGRFKKCHFSESGMFSKGRNEFAATLAF